MPCKKISQSELRTGDTERLLPGGEACVRHGQDVFLVPNTLPGEKILFTDRGRRRGARRGELEQVLRPSPHRVPAPCPYAGECGGCALQFLHKNWHGKIKSEWVSEAFSSMIEPDTDWQPIESSPVTGRRRRVRWRRGRDEVGSFLGFRARASLKLIRHKRCMVLLPELNDLRQSLEEFIPPKVDSVSMTALADGIHAILETDAAVRPELPEGLLNRDEVQWWWRYGKRIEPLSRPVKVLHDEIISGEKRIQLTIGPDGFVQTQRGMNNEIAGQVLSWTHPARRVVDLFSGAGNFSLPLAVRGMSITGADVDPGSIRAANANARELGVRAEYLQADLLKKFNPAPFVGADVLILDPPRKGARRVCEAMHVMLPRKAIMISCNIAAGARDGKILADRGYHLQVLRALDLFPYSGHVEGMALWIRN